MDFVTVGKIGTTWGTAHMGEWVRWENGLTWEKINPDGKKRTKIEKRTQIGKSEHR